MLPRKLPRPLMHVLLLALVCACGGDKGGTNPPSTSGGFSVSLSSTTLSVQQGDAGTITATITRTGSFSGTVNLSTENVPTGISGSFNPSAVVSGTTSTTLTMAVASTVTPGSYSFAIRCQAAGVADQVTATVTMTVTAPPSIAIAFSPASASIAQGSSATFIGRVSRTNFSGFATLSVAGAPAGVTVTFGQNADSANFLVTVATTAVAGTYPIMITASSAGVASAAATFTLTVTPAPFLLNVAPRSLTVQQGASGQATVNLTRTSFAGPVTLATAGGLPSGITVSFASSPLTTSTTTMTVSVAANNSAGTYSFLVLASAAGAPTQSATIDLQVTPPAVGSIVLSASPSTLSATAGGADVSTTITIARTTFTGSVNLTTNGIPTGATAEFATNPVLGNSSVLIFSFPVGTPVGAYPITVSGFGLGIDAGSTQVIVTVAASASSIGLAADPDALNAPRAAPRRSREGIDITLSCAGGSRDTAKTRKPASGSCMAVRMPGVVMPNSGQRRARL